MTTIEQARREAEKRAMKRNPPAFPTVHNGDGLSMRDYFAAKAMAQLIAIYEPIGDEGTIPACAESAYQYADAMLKARGT